MNKRGQKISMPPHKGRDFQLDVYSKDLLCGLVVRVATDPEVSGSIPGHYKGKIVVGLERGPLSLVSTTEELLGRKSSGSGLEIREYGRRDVTLTTWHPLSAKKLALTSLTSGGHSVCIVRLQTEATEFFYYFLCVFQSNGTFLQDYKA
jgi:hypothetical protein